jgi:hypothetical protein
MADDKSSRDAQNRAAGERQYELAYFAGKHNLAMDYAIWKMNSSTGEMHLCIIRNDANAESLCAKVPSE